MAKRQADGVLYDLGWEKPTTEGYQWFRIDQPYQARLWIGIPLAQFGPLTGKEPNAR